MSVSYKYHRFPIEVIRHCVWLYYTFPLSFRDIEKMMPYRGIEVTYEAIRKWCKKFAQAYANQIRRRRSQPADKWHLDEVVITIKGQQYYLWRAVDTGNGRPPQRCPTSSKQTTTIAIAYIKSNTVSG